MFIPTMFSRRRLFCVTTYRYRCFHRCHRASPMPLPTVSKLSSVGSVFTTAVSHSGTQEQRSTTTGVRPVKSRQQFAHGSTVCTRVNSFIRHSCQQSAHISSDIRGDLTHWAKPWKRGSIDPCSSTVNLGSGTLNASEQQRRSQLRVSFPRLQS